MPPEPVPQDIVVHVGMSKTGTSTIQFFLRDNRERLGELGVLVPESPGKGRHTRFGQFLRPEAELAKTIEWSRQKNQDVVAFRRKFRKQLFAEIDARGTGRLLLTDEALFGGSAPTLRRLGAFTGRLGRTTRLVVYLRRQDAHLISRYQQLVKVGWVARIGDWARGDMSDLYDYRARLGRFERLASPDEVVVRRFEPGSFRDGSLLQDFFDAAGIDARAADLGRGPDRNLSLDAESVEFLRLLNLHRVETEGAVPGLIDNRDNFTRLAEVSDGPVLSLPDDLLDAFMDRWRDSNQQVARDYLHDESGQLFRAPRKSANVTTDQRLDPARLDHFVELLELPEDIRDPLRRLAEREANSP